MTTYLQMNGTGDYLHTPQLTFTRVVLDFLYNNGNQYQYLIDGRGGTSGNYMVYMSGNTVNNNGATSLLFNGSSTIPNPLPINTRGTLDVTFSTTITTGSNGVFIFDNYIKQSADSANGNIYDIKLYNGSTLVAHYDMSTGTVNDQSGNGYNATLVGGTWANSTPSGTAYIGSGTATGKANLTSNETLISSEHGTVTGQSNNTSNETFVGATGTTYSASGTVSGKSNLTSSETLILRSTGNAQGQSSLTSNEHEILSASGTIQGSSYLQSNENLIQHTGTIYSASGTVTGQSNASSHETMSLSANGEVKGQSSLTSNEKLIFFVTGIAQGQSSLKSNEKLISVKQIISRVTLQGSRELHVILDGNRELNVILEGNRKLHVILKGGADVPAENQNLTLEAGTDKIIEIPNIVDSTSPLDLTTCLEVHYQAKSGSTVISKDLTNGITVTSPTDLSIALLPADSHGLSGFFKHEVWCVDSNGKKSLLTKGNLIIKPSYADVN